MKKLWSITCLLIFLIQGFVSFGQKGGAEPVITGQNPSPLSTLQGTPITITLANLIVTPADPASVYPNGFKLEVNSGKDYTVSGTTVTPDSDFIGLLKVRVRVIEGDRESNWFDLKINVKASATAAPQITGQTPITINQGESVTITLGQLTVTDSDDNYPSGFTLTVYSGNNYTVAGTTVTPAPNFSGNLKVQVSVNDGENESKRFDLKIDVIATGNVAPQITGQKKLSAKQGTPFSISLSDLTVIDPDNKYPNDFTLKIVQGDNYVAAGNTINPSSTFVGTLNVTVSVSDGTASSPNFNVQVEIITTKTNVAPTIVGQKAISITQNTSITLQLFHLEVSDPDNQFPAGFSLKVFPGTNYTVSGTKVTPKAGFVNSILSVGVKVNDGSDDSQLFELKIQVTPISATPRIDGQKELTVMEDNVITITLSDLIVTDADNPNYPAGFTLRVVAGGEGVYSANGNTVRPASNFNGFMEVGVTVNDGLNTSAEFRLAILVTPVNDAPLITLLEASPLSFEPGNGPAEVFRRLVLADVDNEYLSMAEIGFREPNHSPQHDDLLLDYENPKIRAVQDSAGILFLIGTATVEDYQAALRSIKYNYRVTKDLNGKPVEILSTPRTIFVNVYDGQDVSLTSERTVSIEAKIVLDIPSAFTPNGDNANDTWQLGVSDIDLPKQMILKVYNKRGLLVHESGGLEKEWDGMFNGELLPADTYYYTIIVNLPYTRQTYSGVVTVLY
jgi:gliding motility-associated-like protein